MDRLQRAKDAEIDLIRATIALHEAHIVYQRDMLAQRLGERNDEFDNSMRLAAVLEREHMALEGARWDYRDALRRLTEWGDGNE